MVRLSPPFFSLPPSFSFVKYASKRGQSDRFAPLPPLHSGLYSLLFEPSFSSLPLTPVSRPLSSSCPSFLCFALMPVPVTAFHSSHTREREEERGSSRGTRPSFPLKEKERERERPQTYNSFLPFLPLPEDLSVFLHPPFFFLSF